MSILTIKESTAKALLPGANKFFQGGSFPTYGVLTGSHFTPGLTEVQLGKVTITAPGTASVIFSSIPQVYTTLCLYLHLLDTYVGSSYTVNLAVGNGSVDFGANYAIQQLWSIGTVPGAGAAVGQTSFNLGNVTTVTGAGSSVQRTTSVRTVIPYYSNTTWKKYLVSHCSSALSSAVNNVQDVLVGGEWANTAAINIMQLYAGLQFSTGTTVILTGIP